MQLRFWLHFLALTTLLRVGVGLHAQDRLSIGSRSLGMKNMKTTRLVHGFDYRQTNRTIDIDFGGTALMPKAEGHAKVEAKDGGIKIDIHVHGLGPAHTLEPSQLTYVLWAVTSDSKVRNLGEMKVRDGNATLTTFTDLPNFAMMVTAEPYFAVKRPSDYIVLYNLSRPHSEEIVRADLLPLRPDEKTPLDIYEARNAVRIARQAGAERYAEELFGRALQLLQQAESMITSHKQHDASVVEEKARQATEAAENARATAEQNQQQTIAIVP